jgi:hypothetical protein
MNTEKNNSANRGNRAHPVLLDYRPIADRIRADPEGFLIDSEDWKSPDTFASRIQAVQVLLLSFVDEVGATIRAANEAKSPADLRTALLDLMMAAGQPLWILEYGLRIDALASGYNIDVDSPADRAAVLFAEIQRSQRSRHPWEILPGLNQQERERLAQLDYLCAATGTTLTEFISKVRKGWNDDEDSSEEIESAESNTRLIAEIDEKLSKGRKGIKEAKAKRARVFEAREKISNKEERFIELTDQLEVLDAKIGTLQNDQQEHRKRLKDYKQRNPRGVEDARTLRSFLAGKRTQQGKLDTMRQFFSDRLKAQNRNGWLQTYIDDFFPRAELRGKKKISEEPPGSGEV